MDQKALKLEFLTESFESLERVDQQLTQLEEGPEDSELLNEIYRAVHTMKGSAGFLGYKNLESITHAAENLLDHLREGTFSLDAEVVDGLLKSFDAFRVALHHLETADEEGPLEVSELEATLNGIVEKRLSSPAKEEEGPGPTASDDQKSNSATAQGASPAAIDSLREQVAQGLLDPSVLSELEGDETPSASPLSSNVDEGLSLEPGVSMRSSVADSVVKVNVSTLDKIMNVVGELVLSRNQILQFSNRSKSPELARLSQELNSITSELQSEVMNTRMQPIGSLLTKFERMVRDEARESGKKIRLRLTGQETELDKTLVEAIKDPLVHVVRNAVDHGMETVEEREARGKPAVGTIHIKSYSESGQVIVEVEDDGRGMDVKSIGAKAVSKGLVSEAELLKMGPLQVLNFVFVPGFSTAETVTRLSGRGVGMDVVKNNIEKTGGTIGITSEEGVGTTIKVRIPLTLAIIPALVVKDAGQPYAIPQLNLLELVRLEGKADRELLSTVGGSEFLRLRGRMTPLFRLGRLLGLRQDVVRPEDLRKRIQNIAILDADHFVFGVLVDEVLDTEEIVVKPLNQRLKNLGVFGGATIMGNGDVALILDPPGFVNRFVDLEHAKDLSGRSVDKDREDEREVGESQENLLFRLSDQGLYATPLMFVSRLEEFEAKKVEMVGGQAIIRYDGHPMPLIDIAHVLGLPEKEHRPGPSEQEKVSCIVVCLRGQSFGILVEEILDIATEDVGIAPPAFEREGVLGCYFRGDDLVSVLDVYAILGEKGAGLLRGTEGRGGGRAKVLLVEDSSAFRSMETSVLEGEGYQVVSAANGEKALEVLFDNEDVEVVLTDIEMPIMDGFEFTKHVRAQNKFSDLKVVALSSRFTEEYREKGKKAGVDVYLEKFNKDQVIQTIERVLKKA